MWNKSALLKVFLFAFSLFDLVVLCLCFFIWFEFLLFELSKKKISITFFSKMSRLWISYLMKWSFYPFGGWMLKKKLSFYFHIWWISSLQSLLWSRPVVMTSHMLSGIFLPLWRFFCLLVGYTQLYIDEGQSAPMWNSTV